VSNISSDVHGPRDNTIDELATILEDRLVLIRGAPAGLLIFCMVRWSNGDFLLGPQVNKRATQSKGPILGFDMLQYELKAQILGPDRRPW
jgi:hypothetical protein